MKSYVISEIKNIIETINRYDFWLYLAWSDIKARYRRTIIGPFWLVIANFVTIASMAVIWSLIFKMNIKDYFPKLTAAMICWTLISYSIVESSTTFTQHYSVISNLSVSLYIFPLRIVMRNLITFFHNLLIFIGVGVTFGIPVNGNTLLFVPMLLILVINFFFLSFTVGLVSARFRDMQQILTSVMTVLVFITPVMWDAEMLGAHRLLANLNPLTHILNVIKFPLLGLAVPSISIICLVSFTCINLIIMMFVSKQYKHRIAFWM